MSTLLPKHVVKQFYFINRVIGLEITFNMSYGIKTSLRAIDKIIFLNQEKYNNMNAFRKRISLRIHKFSF